MISIRTVSFKQAATAPLSASFGAAGGSIGRAAENDLILPDAEQTISRVHAQVVCRAGQYAIVDRGSNPIVHNGESLGNGREAPLRIGDELEIGGYRLRVESATQSPASVASATADDIFASLGFGVSPGAAAGLSPSRLSPIVVAAAPPSPAGGIPDDWDPFAADAASAGRQPPPPAPWQPSPPPTPPTPPPARSPAPPVAAAGAGSLDDLFGLSSAAPVDALAGWGTAMPAAASQTPPLSPAVTLRSAAAPTVPRTVVSVSAASAPAAAARPAQPVNSTRRPDPVPPADAMLSWTDPSGESRSIIRPRRAAPLPLPTALPMAMPAPGGLPAGPGDAPPGTPPLDLALDLELPATTVIPPHASFSASVSVSASNPAPAEAAPAPGHAPSTAPPVPTRPSPSAGTPAWQPPRGTQPESTTPTATPSAQNADLAALTSALHEGLGLRELPASAQSLTPALLRLLGTLVQEATRGTVDLLAARAALKREIRAEVTMIVSRENNPLKFSPSAEVALGHLLGPASRGFMEPQRAMRDAYEDLRAHQFGFLAGMRAALEGVFRRFDPAVLEGRLTEKSMLSTLMPGMRKAQMWDVFTELYGQISSEASDDFHRLFGEEFLRAYNEYIDQLAPDRP